VYRGLNAILLGGISMEEMRGLDYIMIGAFNPCRAYFKKVPYFFEKGLVFF
jgi:hypothetical protein